MFSKEDVIAYCDYVTERTGELVESAPFDGSSGFHWLQFSKAEAHLYNLRHIQHHVGQLNERLRQESTSVSRWIHNG